MSYLHTFGSDEMDSDDVPGGAGPFGGSRIYETKPLPTISSLASDHPSIPFLSKFDDLVMHIDIPQYLTDNKTILRFPDKLLLLLVEAEREALRNGQSPDEACILWTSNGRAFVARNNRECLERLLSIISAAGQLSSFTRKLYRWGFRQVTSSPKNTFEKSEKVFWHPDFQRDNKLLTIKMSSSTAEGKRKAESAKAIAASRSAKLRNAEPPRDAADSASVRTLALDRTQASSSSLFQLSQMPNTTLPELPGGGFHVSQPMQHTVSLMQSGVTDQLFALLNNRSQSLIYQPLSVAGRDVTEWNAAMWQVGIPIESTPSLQLPTTSPYSVGADQLAADLRFVRLLQQALSSAPQDNADYDTVMLHQSQPQVHNAQTTDLRVLGSEANSSPNDLTRTQTRMLSGLRDDQAIIRAILGASGYPMPESSQQTEQQN